MPPVASLESPRPVAVAGPPRSAPATSPQEVETVAPEVTDVFVDADPAPPAGRMTRALEAVCNRVAPQKQDADPYAKIGPSIITEERVLSEFKGSAWGIEYGVTFSELHQVRPSDGGGIELVHVVGPDGSSNLETVLWRKPIGLGHRVELQGPAINSDLAAAFPLGCRVAGVGLTSDLIDPAAAEAISYTAEVKITDKTLVELAKATLPGVAGAVAGAIRGGSNLHGVANAVAWGFAAAVPVVNAALALTSARWAVRVWKNPKMDNAARVMAIAHAMADAVRIFFPITGTIASAALVGVGLTTAAVKVRRLRAEIAARREAAGAGAAATA